MSGDSWESTWYLAGGTRWRSKRIDVALDDDDRRIDLAAYCIVPQT